MVFIRSSYYEPDDTYIDDMYDRHIDKQMENQRRETFEKLSDLVSPNFVEDFAKVLCTGYLNYCQISERLFLQMGFDMSTIFAVTEDFTAYKADYEKNRRYEV